MIRRFETYSIDPAATPEAVDRFERACRACDRFIPEVLYGHVGWNRSPAPADFVWEHAFASPESYQAYMAHRYHAAVLDRYLLHDSPERVVRDNDLGAGLFGYRCAAPAFAMSGGVRRVVLLRLAPSASLPDQPDLARGLSVGGANTIGAAWFDGVTPLPGRPRWTHVWEQGFSSLAALDAVLAEGGGGAGERREVSVEEAVSLHYVIDGRRP